MNDAGKKVKQLCVQAIDFLLYSNIFIALGAMSMVWQTLHISGLMNWWHPYAWLVFFATVLVYALHRLIGFTIIERRLDNRRMQLITEHSQHLSIYALLASAVCLYLCLRIGLKTLLGLWPAVLVAILYVVPIFQGRRFRDLPYVKLFAIGMVWSWVTVLVPGLEFTTLTSYQVSLLFLEKTLFIIGITIPFDIRDLEVDAHYKIDTVPLRFGVYKSKVFASASIVFAWLTALLLYLASIYQLSQVTGLLVFYLFSIFSVGSSQKHLHDYYFSGLLDGLILLQFITVYQCA